jgi:hypothetical protein
MATDTGKVAPPHEYKIQRKRERHALEARKRTLAAGNQLPPVCGYTYNPRKPKDPSVKFDPAPTVCMVTAGANTDHPGKGFCDYHDWAAEHEIQRQPVQVQAARREAMTSLQFLGRPKPTDPYMALLEEIQRSAGIVEWLREKMIGMAQEYEDIREAAGGKSKVYSESGEIVDIPTENDILIQWSPKNGQQPSAWWILYQEERAHLVRTSTAAIKAGVAERRVAIAEQQGAMIVAMFQAFIHDTALALSPEQIMLAPKLIMKHMAALPRNEAAPRAIEAASYG